MPTVEQDKPTEGRTDYGNLPEGEGRIATVAAGSAGSWNALQQEGLEEFQVEQEAGALEMPRSD